MEYVSRVPAPPLDEFIDDIYCLTGVPRHRRMNVPPMPSAHLFINLGDPARLRDSDPSVPSAMLADGWFMGVWTRRFVVEYPAWVRLVGVHFKPWGISPFTGLPATELRDRWVPAPRRAGVPAGPRSDARRLIFYKPGRPRGRQDRGRRIQPDTGELREETQGEAVGTVIMHNVVSVDGFIADENDDVGPLHDWYFSGDTPITEDGDQPYDHSGTGSRFKVSRASAEYVRSMWASIGTIVIGRTLFDLVNGWEGKPPAGDHVVVVSHRPKPEGWHPEASCHFAGSVTAAIGKAQELAGDRTVAVNAGDVGSQILAAGLVDEVAMDVVPVVFGSGKRYFGGIDRQHLLEDPHVVIQGDRVLHLRFKVRR